MTSDISKSFFVVEVKRIVHLTIDTEDKLWSNLDSRRCVAVQVSS